MYTIRTFVKRYRKLSDNKLSFISKNMPIFGISLNTKILSFSSLFSNFNLNDSVILEIGFGRGDSIIHLAKMYPLKFFIGIDVYTPGILFCLKNIKKYNINNLKIVHFDAIFFINQNVPNFSISIIQIFFPDPWKKKKHNKRRIIQKDIINLFWKKLINYGYIHIITDCNLYAKHILQVFHCTFFCNKSYDIEKIFYFNTRLITKFEKKSYKKGFKVQHFLFQKK